MTVIEIDYFESTFGAYAGKIRFNTHEENDCIGPFCVIHNPSDHPLREASMQWRGDRGFMERRCVHEQGHPDPDDLAFKRMIMTEEEFASKAFEWHGCDGCCQPERKKMTEAVIPVSKWEHCGDTKPHVTHTYDVSEQGVPTHCLGSPWTEQNDDQN